MAQVVHLGHRKGLMYTPCYEGPYVGMFMILCIKTQHELTFIRLLICLYLTYPARRKPYFKMVRVKGRLTALQ